MVTMPAGWIWLGPYNSPETWIATTARDLEQSKAFIEKAREIGTDEKRSASDKLMAKLAKMKPEPRKKANVR